MSRGALLESQKAFLDGQRSAAWSWSGHLFGQLLSGHGKGGRGREGQLLSEQLLEYQS